MKTHRRRNLSLFFTFRLTLYIVLSLAVLFINQNSFAQYCETPDESDILMMGGGGFGNPDCQNHLNYFPDAYSPVLYVKVNFHFMLKEDAFDPNNFTETWDGIDNDNPLNGDIWSEGLRDMINNSQLNNNEQMNLPPDNSTATLPYNFRIQLMGTYYHEDNNLWDACNGDYTTLVNTYGVNTSSEINIFFSASSGGPGCGAGGLGPGHVLIKGAWQGYLTMLNGNSPSTALENSYWANGRLLLHEIGHCLSLYHTLNSNMNGFPFCGGSSDGCADTPEYTDLVNIYGVDNPCCYSNWPIACDPSEECTNNLMDYNCGFALSPEQLGRIFKTLLNSKINYIYEDYCTNNTNLVTTIPSGQNLLWNQVRIFKGDVIIEPQSTVTITCIVYMPEGAKFIVKPGAKLIIDGGTITHRCGGLWQGIEVWGNSTLKQSPESNQGVVEIINEGTIEWAKTGINTIRVLADGTLDWSKTGGIIKCRDANFLNNAKSIAFMAYHNFNSSGQIANRSYFKNSHFEITDVSRFNNQSHDCFISMWDVNGIKIYGCDFENSVTDISLEQKGHGLFTIQSTFKVDDFCTSTIPLGGSCPESDLIRSRFENLNYGIRSAGLMTSMLLSVENAQFINNRGGIFLSGFGQSQIIKNDFDWVEIIDPDQQQTFGVYLQECKGYEVEENFFDAHDGEETYGVAINNSGEYATLIYRNTFHRCHAASMVYGVNRVLAGGFDDHPGLEWSCNVYGESGNDTKMNYYGIGLWNNAAHSSYQGVLSESGAAGNLFYPECDPDNGIDPEERELKLLEQEDPSYYDYIHTPNDATEPLCRTFGIGLLNNNQNDWVYGQLGVCVKNISTEKPPIYHHNLVGFNHNIYVQLKAAYDGYINNGSGTALRSLILDPTKSSIEVRNALMDAAPRVADQLLIAALHRSPEMDGWHMAQALLANSPLKAAVLADLENTDYLEFYKILVNNNQPNGLSTRTLMAMDATHYRSEQDNSKDDLLRSYAGDYEEVTFWPELIQASNDFAYCIQPWEKAAIFMEKGDFVSANAVLANCNIDPARCQMLELALAMQENGMSSTGLTAPIQSELSVIASDPENLMNATASLMLEFWGGSSYLEFLALPEGAEPRTQRVKGNGDILEIQNINVFPNPANDNIRFTCLLPLEAESAVLTIYNPQGQIIVTLNARQENGIFELNTKEWASGIYLADLVADGIKLGTSSVCIIH
jgi:hypothetical protein